MTLLAAGSLPCATAADLVLTWTDNADNETGFRIERALGSGGFAQVALVGANAVSYTDSELFPATTYRYRVCAYNAYGDSDFSNIATATTSVVLPSNQSPTIGSIADIVVAMGSGSGPIGFVVDDDESGPDGLTLEAASSNPSLVPLGGVVFGGSGANRTVTVTPAIGQSGSATITVAVSDGSLSASEAFVVSVRPLPTISTQPVGGTVTAGGALTLEVEAQGNGTVTYQWLLNGEAIPGATGATYTIPSVQVFHSGQYQVVVSADGVSRTSNAATVSAVVPPASDATLLNLSTRAICSTGDDTMVLGFVVRGTGTKQVLLRGVGPTLADFGVSATLPDPQILLKRKVGNEYQDYAFNDDWSTGADALEIAAVASRVGAFELIPGSSDAVLLLDLPPGQYSVSATDASGEIGVGMAELYDADIEPFGTELANVSSRGFVGTGQDVMIPGFVVSSEGPKTLLIRAVGPTLDGFEVVGALRDPHLVVYRHVPETSTDEEILSNDNWGEHGDDDSIVQAAAQVGAFPLVAGSRDAAFIVTLEPGVYSVHAAGVDGATGVALVEIYEIQ